MAPQIAKMLETRFPRLLLGSWPPAFRLIMRPQQTIRHSCHHTSWSALYLDSSDFSEWMPIVRDISKWSETVETSLNLPPGTFWMFFLFFSFLLVFPLLLEFFPLVSEIVSLLTPLLSIAHNPKKRSFYLHVMHVFSDKSEFAQANRHTCVFSRCFPSKIADMPT